MNKLSNIEQLDAAAANAELKKPLKEIFQAWPNLHQITLKLISFMGDIIPSNKNMPLIELCLINAVNGFRSVSAMEYATEAQMVAYIRGLLVEAPQIIKVSVGTLNDDPTLWEPFLQDVSSFKDQYKGLVKIYHTPYSDVKADSVRLMILARIITTRDLYWIDQYASLPSLLGEAA
jgi:hypothetical protein